MTIELLPCALCKTTEPIGDTHNETRTFTITCANTLCAEHNLNDGHKKTRLQAIQAWNKRQLTKRR